MWPLPITHYRLFNDPFDRFFGDQLSFFDPWHDFDTFPTAFPSFRNRFRWINEPRRFSRSASSSYNSSLSNNISSGSTSIPITNTVFPTQSEKFRVQLDVAGFNPETIRTRIEGRKLIVEAKQEERQVDGDYSIREFRKTYELPEYSDSGNLASFVTPNNTLVIEVPVNSPSTTYHSSVPASIQPLSIFGQYRDPLFDYSGFIGSNEFNPRVVDTGTGQKQLKMSISVKNYRPEQIKVSVKNNELRVQAEHNFNDSNRSERSFFTKSITLPPGTQIDRLTSFLNNEGRLEIEAPFVEQTQSRPIHVRY